MIETRLKLLARFVALLLLVVLVMGSVSASDSAAPAQAQGVWQSLAPTGSARQEVSYVQVNGKFYLAGGATLQQVYDPIANSWATVAPLPTKLDHIQGVALNNLIYYVGGLISWPSQQVSTVYIYNPATNTFTQGANMTRGRGAGGVAVYNGKIYYAGGLNSGNAVNWFDVYDPVSNVWSALPNMPTIRDHFHGAVVNGKFYAIGGRNTQIDATTPRVDAFDFASNTWSTLNTQLPHPRGGFAVAVEGTEILVIGGEGGGIAHSEVEAYNTATNSWRSLTPMATPRHGIEAINCNGGIYIAAGATAQGSAPSQVNDVLYLNGTTTCGTASGPTLSPSPTSLSFGSVNVGSNASQNITLTNQSGTTSLQITNLSISGTTDYSITSAPSLPATVAPNGSVNLTVRFAPTASGSITASLTVIHSGANSPLSINLGGTGVGGANQAVTSFSLVQTSNGQPIAGFDPIPNGGTINVANLPTKQVSFRANTSPASVGSVRFGIDSVSNYLTDNSAPYYLGADFTNASGWVGSHTLTGTPYTGANASGTVGTPLTITFQLTNTVTPSPTPPTPTPPPVPTNTPVPPTLPPQPPAAPSNLGANAVSTSQINLTWTDNANNETGFEIQRSTTGSGGTYSPLTTVGANVVSYSNTGLSASTQYCYRVRATNGAGTSSFTSAACATTNAITQSVVSFTLINAGTGQPIAGYNPIPNGSVISVSALPTRNVIFRATTSPATVGSVRFGVDAFSNYLTDNNSTYDLPANLAGSGWLGSHTLKATPYTGANAGGTAGTALTISIQLTN